MKKPTPLIYLNNSIAFIIFSFLKIFFKKKSFKKNQNEKNILFINTGQIGDLIISSVVLENISLFSGYDNFYFLIKKKYKEIFNDYTGDVRFIEWNQLKYKYNIFHRISFLRKLRKINFMECINITSARGIINDELSLLSGANKISCLSSSWKYLKKLFGKKMDGKYDSVYKFNTINEFERQLFLIEKLANVLPKKETNFYIKNETVDRVKSIFKEKFKIEPNNNLIIISPFSGLKIKNWEIKKYYNLCGKIINQTDLFIVLIGNKNQRKKLNKIAKMDRQKIINAAGSFSVTESAALIKLSELFIGNDSGFTHAAKALNKNIIAIIGGGSYNIFFPYAPKINQFFLYYKMECFGCEWRCIYNKPYCHFNVSVEEVFQKISVLLAS